MRKEEQRARVIFQTEYEAGPYRYMALDQQELGSYARALGRCWRLLGLKKGDCVALFDYGTSPICYLASSAFTPYLTRGAAEMLGCMAICNDGVPHMSSRALEILKYVRPRFLFVRQDCLYPLVQESRKQGRSLAPCVQGLVVAENEGLLPQESQQHYQQTLGIPVYRLLRVDAAMFLAMECPSCRLLHTWRDLYRVQVLDETSLEPLGPGRPGLLAITNRFAKASSKSGYVSRVRGTLVAGGCPGRPEDHRIKP